MKVKGETPHSIEDERGMKMKKDQEMTPGIERRKTKRKKSF